MFNPYISITYSSFGWAAYLHHPSPYWNGPIGSSGGTLRGAFMAAKDFLEYQGVTLPVMIDRRSYHMEKQYQKYLQEQAEKETY